MNTDDLYPAFAGKLPLDEAARHVFSASRPGWTDLVQAGDIVVGGRGFGMGSSRPAAVLLRQLGVSCLLAEQFNSLFFRNCVNYGLPAMAVPGVRSLLTEGDEVLVDLAAGTVRNARTDVILRGEVLPAFLLDIVMSGGLQSMLEARGLILREG